MQYFQSAYYLTYSIAGVAIPSRGIADRNGLWQSEAHSSPHCPPHATSHHRGRKLELTTPSHHRRGLLLHEMTPTPSSMVVALAVAGEPGDGICPPAVGVGRHGVVPSVAPESAAPRVLVV